VSLGGNEWGELGTRNSLDTSVAGRKPVPGVLQLVRLDFESEGKTYITRAIWLWERYSYSFPNSYDTVLSLPAVAFMTQPRYSKPLIRRTTPQEDSINSLLHDYLSPVRDADMAPCSWEALRNSYWGKGLDSLEEEELVDRGENPVKDPTLPDLFPPTRSVLSPHRILSVVWWLVSQKVLVRSEYYEAEAAALSASEEGKGVFIVTGQRKIGPPLSLPIHHKI